MAAVSSLIPVSSTPPVMSAKEVVNPHKWKTTK
jgi:hypothetical protein